MLKSLDGIQIITAESEKKVKLTSSPIVEYQQYRWMWITVYVDFDRRYDSQEILILVIWTDYLWFLVTNRADTAC